MKPRLLFTRRGGVIRTRSFQWPAWLWPLNVIALLIALYGVVAMLDDMDERVRAERALALEKARAEGYEAGRQRGNEEMLKSAQAAWQAALTEGEERCAWRRP